MRKSALVSSVAMGTAVAIASVLSTHYGVGHRLEGSGAETAPVAFAPPEPIAPLPAAEPPPIRTPVEERAVEEAPVSLTATDGSGLAIAELRARAVVEGPLAFTEIRLAFDNGEDRVREGTFKIALPQGATLSRFAMKIGDGWQEGEVVAKEHARRAYEDFLHRKQDPALMEKGAGNEFTARVFPIPARGRKEIVVSYVEEVVNGQAYSLPLRGMPVLGHLDVAVTEDGAPAGSLVRDRFTPTSDFVAETGGRASPSALRSGERVVARVRPVPEAMPDPVRRAVVLVDTSASRALGLASELRAVKSMLRAMAEREGGSLHVSVAAFDQEVFPVCEGESDAFDDAAIDRIVARRALGASNVERALGWAKGEAKRIGAARVVLVTDGVATAGEDDGAKLAAVAASLKDAGAERLDVVAVGGLRDDALAHKLVTAGLARDGVVAMASEGVASLVRRLEEGTRSNVAVAVEGARWAYPTRLDGVQPGDETLVYAELPAGMPVRVRVGDRASTLDAIPSDGALVERAWARAKIASLEGEERDHGKSPEIEKSIVDLSTKNHVMSDYTALLVLESDADYARFHIDRRANDVLTVDQGRLALAKRGDLPRGPEKASARVATLDDRATAPADKGDSFGGAEDTKVSGESLGGIGFSSLGSGGGAMGAGHASARSQGYARPAPIAAAAPAATSEGGTGTRARGEEGSMGNPSPARAAPMMDMPVASPASPPPPAGASASSGALAREADAVEVGILGALGGSNAAQGAAQAPGFAAPQEERGADPYTGKFKQVKDRLARHDSGGALAVASSWQASQPGDVLALVALGESSEATGDVPTAARAYGSIVDLFSSRADLRRFAGERLEHLASDGALDLAIDTFDKARRDRPDHPASHRLAAFARVRKGDYAGAFDIAVAALAQRYPEGRFRGVDRILREDLGLIAAAWMKSDPERKSEILARVRAAGGSIESGPSLRFVLNWETDSNDVDFHINDAQGGHAYYASPELPSGGSLYADVTTGYGPECFTIRGPRSMRAGPYRLRAHYFARGPMGYGMGKLEIIDHDGHGNLRFEERPFIVMTDHAFVDLGTIKN